MPELALRCPVVMNTPSGPAGGAALRQAFYDSGELTLKAFSPVFSFLGISASLMPAADPLYPRMRRIALRFCVLNLHAELVILKQEPGTEGE